MPFVSRFGFQVFQQNKADQRTPYLDHDCIRTGTYKGVNLQVLLDEFEKYLNLPAFPVSQGNVGSCPNKIVGQELKLPQLFNIVIPYQLFERIARKQLDNLTKKCNLAHGAWYFKALDILKVQPLRQCSFF